MTFEHAQQACDYLMEWNHAPVSRPEALYALGVIRETLPLFTREALERLTNHLSECYKWNCAYIYRKPHDMTNPGFAGQVTADAINARLRTWD
jgi:hypothetical protein